MGPPEGTGNAHSSNVGVRRRSRRAHLGGEAVEALAERAELARERGGEVAVQRGAALRAQRGARPEALQRRALRAHARAARRRRELLANALEVAHAVLRGPLRRRGALQARRRCLPRPVLAPPLLILPRTVRHLHARVRLLVPHRRLHTHRRERPARSACRVRGPEERRAPACRSCWCG